MKMTNDEFDAALVGAAFELGAEGGWRKVTAAAAARHAGLDLARARARFPGPGAVLRRFGALADAHALTGANAGASHSGASPADALPEGSVKDRLFDIILRRFDFLQMHRAGVAALVRYLPLDPVLNAWLARETLKSMGWMLEGAGVSSRGVRGELAKRGLAVVWAWGLRAWLRDETEDLSTTMAAVDVALTRADQIASRFNRDGFVPESASAEAGLQDPDDAELPIVLPPKPPGD
jgi:ubiquinone biosynthesis protein COQ9